MVEMVLLPPPHEASGMRKAMAGVLCGTLGTAALVAGAVSVLLLKAAADISKWSER